MIPCIYLSNSGPLLGEIVSKDRDGWKVRIGRQDFSFPCGYWTADGSPDDVLEFETLDEAKERLAEIRKAERAGWRYL